VSIRKDESDSFLGTVSVLERQAKLLFLVRVRVRVRVRANY
jgi:hypothetical protein